PEKKYHILKRAEGNMGLRGEFSVAAADGPGNTINRVYAMPDQLVESGFVVKINFVNSLWRVIAPTIEDTKVPGKTYDPYAQDWMKLASFGLSTLAERITINLLKAFDGLVSDRYSVRISKVTAGESGEGRQFV